MANIRLRAAFLRASSAAPWTGEGLIRSDAAVGGGPA
jgi:hypothetical protein